MPAFRDVTGQKFGRLTVLRRADKRPGDIKVWWVCKCDCGKDSVVKADSLLSGVTQSCGCLMMDVLRARREDVTGQKFGRLTAVCFDHRAPNRASYWRFKCDCGKECVCSLSHVKAGRIASCGCYHDEVAGDAVRTHGMSRIGSKVYAVWKNMVQRCTNPNNTRYADYGGRGIAMCPEWGDSFERFYADMGDLPFDGAEIDRIDNMGNYCRDNCRWATDREQVNNRRNTVLISLYGRTVPLAPACERFGVDYFLAYNRIVRDGRSASTVFRELKNSAPGVNPDALPV